MKKGKNSLTNRGQMKISFGMIFSIILIILFIFVAFYAITKFLDLQKTVQISKFYDNLQSDIDKIWKSSQGSQEIVYTLPSKIKAVCFVDSDYENLRFDSEEFIEGKLLKNIDLYKTIGNNREKCISTNKGKLKLTLKKTYGDTLVTITG